ncbi:hypothetical protein C2E23DRAFT_225107 [Lenzites betulinus]|nr:hypothetical protein C2E23DRAFT_225107 [Lenzites betulinus]
MSTQAVAPDVSQPPCVASAAPIRPQSSPTHIVSPSTSSLVASKNASETLSSPQATARTHDPSPPVSPPPSNHVSLQSIAKLGGTPSNPSTTSSSQLSMEEQLERLTSAVQETAHLIHVCTVLCEARCAAMRAREEAERTRAGNVQAQLQRMMEMTREMVRREGERPRVSADPQKYVCDLQRAAFGAGGTAESISRSSMIDTDD